MKRFDNFFKSRVPLISNIVLHRDGFSLPGFFSLRLGNIPNNLCSTLQMLTAFNSKLFLGIIFRLFQEVSSKICHDFDPEGVASDIFFTHRETRSNLWVHHTQGASLNEALNNTCGFLLSDKKNVSYSLENCECTFIGKNSGPDYTESFDSVYIYGSNISDQLIDCISAFISDNFCPINKKGLMYFGIAIAALFGAFVCGSSCYIFWDRIVELKNRLMGGYQPIPPPPPPAIPLQVQGNSVAEETRYSDDTPSDSGNSDYALAETPPSVVDDTSPSFN